jgi:general stress protein 26
MAFDLTEYAEAVNSALADGTPCILATIGDDGFPDLGFKGSMMVFDRDHLAYWERTRGQHLNNLRDNPGVAMQYYNRDRHHYLRCYGRAELHEQGPTRDAIMARVVEQELARDPERKGIGVLIRVEKVIDPYGKGTQLRD